MMHTMQWTLTRADGNDLDVIVAYQIEPYVPAKVGGPPEDCYPAEGGYVTDMLVTMDDGTDTPVAITHDEHKTIADWIEQHHDHDADRYGDPDRAYDEMRDRRDWADREDW